MPRIEAIVETAVYADDLQGAGDFYGRVLGLAEAGYAEGRHRFYHVGAGMLLIFVPRATRDADTLPAHGADGPSHFALGISAGEYGAWRQRLMAEGVAIEREVDWPRGGRSLYIRDPAGNLVELITPGVWNDPPAW